MENKEAVAETKRNYIHLTPQCWKNKETGGLFKVIPWFAPVNDTSDFDFNFLLKDLDPIFTEDNMKDFEIYSGLVMKLGYLVENMNKVWMGLAFSEAEVDQHFERMGLWDEEKHRPKKQENNNKEAP